MGISAFVPFHFCLFTIVGTLIGKYSSMTGVFLGVQLFSLVLMGFFSKRYAHGTRDVLGFYIVVALFFISAIAVIVTLRTSSSASQAPHPNNSLVCYKVSKEVSRSEKVIRLLCRANVIGMEMRPSLLLIHISNDSSGHGPFPGDHLFSVKKVKRISGPRNPGAFDYRNYWSKKGVYDELWLRKGEYVYRPSHRRSPGRKLGDLRDFLLHRLRSIGLNQEEFGLSSALLLGNKQWIPEETKKAFKAAGLMHILAISGLHIGVVIFLLHKFLWWLKFFRGGQKIRLLLVLLAVGCYAAITAFPPSVVRASFIFGLYCLCIVLHRKAPWENSIVTSLTFLLLFNPNYIDDLGFLMSYGALISIWLFFPLIKGLWTPKKSWIMNIWELISLAIAAQLGVLPIALHQFHYFSGWFVFSGILVIPLLGSILGLGIILLILGPAVIQIYGLANLYKSLLRFVLSVATSFEKDSLLIAEQVYVTENQAILMVVVMVLLYRYLKRPVNNRLIYMFFGCLLMQIYSWHIGETDTKGEELFVLHDYNRTIALRKGKELAWFRGNSSSDDANAILHDFLSTYPELRINNYVWNHSLKVSEKTILALNPSVPVPKSSGTIDILILSDSPRINLDRLLEQLNASFVVAQGKNNWFDAQRWRRSCETRGVIFHNTASEGAFRLNLLP